MWRLRHARYRKLAHDASKSRWYCFGSRGHSSVRSRHRNWPFLMLFLFLVFLSLAYSSGRSSITSWSGRRRSIATSCHPFLRDLRRRLRLSNDVLRIMRQASWHARICRCLSFRIVCSDRHRRIVLFWQRGDDSGVPSAERSRG